MDFWKLKNSTWIMVTTVVAASLLLLLFFMPTNKDNYETVRQELLQLAENIRDYYKTRPDYWGLDNQSALKNKIIPEKLHNEDKIFSALGREFIIGQDSAGNMVMPGSKSFDITLLKLGKEACMALAAQPFDDTNNLGLLKITIQNKGGITVFEWGSANPLPIPEDRVKEVCKNSNTLSWTFG